MKLAAVSHPRRVLFHEWPPRSAVPTLSLAAARGETALGVAAFRLDAQHFGGAPIELTLSPLPGTLNVELFIAQPVPVRRPSYDAGSADRPGPLTDREWDSPCCLPDPLFPPALCGYLASRTTYSIWVRLRVRWGARAGTVHGRLHVRSGPESADLPVELRIWGFDTPAEPTLSTVNWLCTDSITLHDGHDPFSREWWDALDDVARNMGSHLHDTIFTPALHPPLASHPLEIRMQLVEIHRTGTHRYRFDLRRLDRWADLFDRHGVRRIMLSHLASQWGATHSMGLWIDGRFHKPQPIQSRFYREFMKQWLPAVQAWAERRGILGRVYQCVSDEPSDKNFEHYRDLHHFLRPLAPGLRWMDACSHPEFGELLDTPVPLIDHLDPFLQRRPGPELWTYYCTGPYGRYSNRFIDTPLANLRCGYWQCFVRNVEGFLHWGYNYWRIYPSQQKADVFYRNDGGPFQSGDGFVVYPRPRVKDPADFPAVFDSVRHEMMRQGIQDHGLFTRLALYEDKDPRAGRLMAELRGPLAGSLTDYCRDGERLERFRREAGELLSELYARIRPRTGRAKSTAAGKKLP